MHAEIARTSPESLRKISLSLAEYNLAKEGDDELEWKGKMYDIASLRFSEGKVEVLALVDEAETNLLALLSKISKAASSDTKTPPMALMQYLSVTFTIPEPQENSTFRFACIIAHNTPYSSTDYGALHKIAAPPPRAKA